MKKFITLSIIIVHIFGVTLFHSTRLGAATTGSIVVIVSEQSPIKTISDRQLRRLFMGKTIKLPNGSRAALATYKPVMSEFNEQALKRNNAQVNAAWSRLKFSGRALEPREFSNRVKMMNYIANTPNAIGYIANERLSSQVRAIYTLN